MLRLFVLVLSLGLSHGFGWHGQHHVKKVFGAKMLMTQCIGEDETFALMEKFTRASKSCLRGESLPDPKMPFSYNPINTKDFQNNQFGGQRPFDGSRHYNPPYNHFHRLPYYNNYYPSSYYRYNDPNNYHFRKRRQLVDADEAEMFYWNATMKFMKSRIGNLTCVLKYVGYMDEQENVNYEAIKDKYKRWPLPQKIRDELIDIVDVCKEVSECIPEKFFKKYPYGKEYGRLMKFIKCIKKMETKVCMKKSMISDYYRYKRLYGRGPGMLDVNEDSIMDFYDEDLIVTKMMSQLY